MAKSLKHFRGVKRRNGKHRAKIAEDPELLEKSKKACREFGKGKKTLQAIYTPNTGYNQYHAFMELVTRQKSSTSDELKRAIEYYLKMMDSKRIW